MSSKRKIIDRLIGGAKKVSSAVGSAVGGDKLVDYASSKIAKRMSGDKAKYVSDNTSGKDALKSAGMVGLNVAGVASGGVGLSALRAVGKNVAKRAITKVPVRPSNVRGESVFVKNSTNEAKKEIMRKEINREKSRKYGKVRREKEKTLAKEKQDAWNAIPKEEKLARANKRFIDWAKGPSPYGGSYLK